MQVSCILMLSHIHEFYPKCHAASLFLPHILQLLASCYFIKHVVTCQCQTRKAKVLHRFFSFDGRLWQTGVCIELCDAKNFKKLQLLLEYKNAYSNPGLSCMQIIHSKNFKKKSTPEVNAESMDGSDLDVSFVNLYFLTRKPFPKFGYRLRWRWWSP